MLPNLLVNLLLCAIGFSFGETIESVLVSNNQLHEACQTISTLIAGHGATSYCKVNPAEGTAVCQNLLLVDGAEGLGGFHYHSDGNAGPEAKPISCRRAVEFVNSDLAQANPSGLPVYTQTGSSMTEYDEACRQISRQIAGHGATSYCKAKLGTAVCHNLLHTVDAVTGLAGFHYHSSGNIGPEEKPVSCIAAVQFVHTTIKVEEATSTSVLTPTIEVEEDTSVNTLVSTREVEEETTGSTVVATIEVEEDTAVNTVVPTLEAEEEATVSTVVSTIEMEEDSSTSVLTPTIEVEEDTSVNTLVSTREVEEETTGSTVASFPKFEDDIGISVLVPTVDVDEETWIPFTEEVALINSVIPTGDASTVAHTLVPTIVVKDESIASASLQEIVPLRSAPRRTKKHLRRVVKKKIPMSVGKKLLLTALVVAALYNTVPMVKNQVDLYTDGYLTEVIPLYTPARRQKAFTDLNGNAEKLYDSVTGPIPLYTSVKREKAIKGFFALVDQVYDALTDPIPLCTSTKRQQTIESLAALGHRVYHRVTDPIPLYTSTKRQQTIDSLVALVGQVYHRFTDPIPLYTSKKRQKILDDLAALVYRAYNRFTDPIPLYTSSKRLKAMNYITRLYHSATDPIPLYTSRKRQAALNYFFPAQRIENFKILVDVVVNLVITAAPESVIHRKNMRRN